jgi:endonuclease-8
MPEGDTVWLTARRLDRALAGQVLTRSDFRVPQLAAADLVGSVVTEVVSRGKHLLVRVDDDRTLHSHLRMDGAWHLYPVGQRWRGPAHQVRVVLATATWQAVGFHLHDLALLARADEDRVVGHLGPDLLGPDWDTGEAVRRLLAQPRREIAPALLDQRNLAGIGNLYKAEALFVHGVSPWTPVAAVPRLPALLERARRMLEQNKQRPEQVTTGNPRKGHEHWVFERSGRPCRRCGTPVRSAEQGEPPQQRLTYWCPRCQPEPGPGPGSGSGSGP